MARNATVNILMYSHDTYGLGHIRRTMAIASHLRAPRRNIIILTGSPLAGRFVIPEQIDFVRIPGMIKKTNEEYLPLSIKINPGHALDIRKNLITTTAKTFQPRLFIVDKEPMGLKKEVLPTLAWIRRSLPQGRTVLGLRDIMDDAGTIRKNWTEKGVYEVLESLYSEIWVYGDRALYDPIAEYDIPDAVARKIRFTGYIRRKAIPPRDLESFRQEYGFRTDRPLVVVTTGGGGDGGRVMDLFLSMLEAEPRPLPFETVLISGPFMPKAKRMEVFRRADALKIKSFLFFRQMEKMIAAADLVVTMGGYNTLCEILTQGTMALVIPRERPRREQLIRAEAFARHGLVDYIPWSDATPEGIRGKVFAMLETPGPFREAIARFPMTGIEVMRERIKALRDDAR